MFVRQIADAHLAQFAYLVGCPQSGEAIVFDPQRDVDRYFDEAKRHDLRLVAAADTHIHADYLTGLREMAERGLQVYASREGGADWQYEWLAGSGYQHRLLVHHDTFEVGHVQVRAIHTPGHTPEHLSFLIRDAGAGVDDFVALVSGDFVFVGDVGRPDLLERAAGMTGVMVPAARLQYASIQREFRPLPPFLQVWPAHGAGSACGKSLGDVPTSTVGYELRNNPSIRAASDEQTFVDFILAGQPEPPAYFARMKQQNRTGPPRLGSLPAPRHLDSDAIGRLGPGSTTIVLDTRSRAVFFAGHLRGALLAELNEQFAAVAASYVDENTSICLVVEESRLDEAVRMLVRVGLDRIVAYLSPDALTAYAASGGGLVESRPIDMVRMEEMRRAGIGQVLDVRGVAEFEEGHVPGAMNIPHTRVQQRHAELPRDRPLLVHCNSGTRAAAAVALLERLGFDAVDVDDRLTNYQKQLVKW
jgi:hydroxyacylglutathione hydrolase